MAEENVTVPNAEEEDDDQLPSEDEEKNSDLSDQDAASDKEDGEEEEEEELEPLVEPCTFESQIYNDQKEVELVLKQLVGEEQKLKVPKLLTNQKDSASAPRGIQSLYNSSSSDCTLYCMFAFNTTFDYLLQRTPGLPCERNSPLRILTRQIVTPLRKIGFVGAKRIVALKLAIQRVGHLRTRTVVEKRTTGRFLDDLLKYGLRVEPQLKLHSTNQQVSTISGANSIIVEVGNKKDEEYITSSSLVEKWTLMEEKKLGVPTKNLVVNLKRTAGPFDEPAVILPLITMSLAHCLHGVKRICNYCSANRENSEAIATMECLACFDSDNNHRKLSECTFCDSCFQQSHHRESERHGHIAIPIPPPTLPDNHVVKEGLSLHEAGITYPYELYAIICENVTNHVVYASTDVELESIKEVLQEYLAPGENAAKPEQSSQRAEDPTTKPKSQSEAVLDTPESSQEAEGHDKKDTRLWVYYDPEAIVKEDARGGYNIPQVYAIEDFPTLINHKTLDKTHDLVDAFGDNINAQHQYRILCESVALFYRPVSSEK